MSTRIHPIESKRHLYKKIQSVVCLLIVLCIVILTFIFKDEIEQNTSSGYLGLFIGCIASTSTILLPAPGIVVVLQYASLLNPYIVVLVGAIGTALGEFTGYYLGKCGNELTNLDTNKRLFKSMKRHSYITIFLVSIIPLPVFDFIGLCAGALNLNKLKFFISCMLGKAVKLYAYVFMFEYLIDTVFNNIGIAI